MQTYLLDLKVDSWLFVVNGYKYPETPTNDLDEKKLCSYNYNARHNILNALSPTILAKVICCKSAK